MEVAAVDPRAFFAQYNLNESLLLQIEYDQRRRSLSLVLNYAGDCTAVGDPKQPASAIPANNKPPNAVFLWLQFENVVPLVSPGEHFIQLDTFHSGRGNLSSRPTVIYGISVELQNRESRIRFSTNTIGDIGFSFFKLSYRQRVGIPAKNVNNTYLYTDSTSGEVIDFYNPFSE